MAKFYTYIALFKEYKNINFVIKRNMVESNEVTLMELYQKWSWSFDETNYFQACQRMSVFSIFRQFQLFKLVHNLSSISIFTLFHNFFFILLWQMLSLETSNLKDTIIGRISEWGITHLYFWYLSFSLLWVALLLVLPGHLNLCVHLRMCEKQRTKER